MIDLNHTRNLAVRPCAGFFVAVLMLGVLLAASGPAQTFTVLHSFTATGASSPHTNSDGANPRAGLIISGNTLYGTANGGGSSGFGTVFSLSTNGTGFTNLHSFTTLSLILPQLTINVTGTNVFLMWPTGFDTLQYTYRLQSTTNLVSPVVWFPVFPDPVVVNGQNIVPNPISGTQQFYRLIQQNRSVSGGCTSDTDCPLGYTCIGGSCHNRQ